jgi:hypothetical protein
MNLHNYGKAMEKRPVTNPSRSPSSCYASTSGPHNHLVNMNDVRNITDQ